MKYDPNLASCYAANYELQMRLEREAELQEKIFRIVSRFNESELKMALDYMDKLYRVSEAYQMDLAAAEYIKKQEEEQDKKEK